MIMKDFSALRIIRSDDHAAALAGCAAGQARAGP
jgi:hypothetical protein